MTPAVPTNSTPAPEIQAGPTRRTTFGWAAALAAIGLPASAPAKPMISDAEFIRAIAFLHPNGASAARHALAAGMRPEWMYAVMLATPNEDPALLFKNEGQHWTFRPEGLVA